MYKKTRAAVSVSNGKGLVKIDTSGIKEILDHYTHPHAFLTLKFNGANLDFSSDGLVTYRFDGKDSYCTIDLRKSNEVLYYAVDEHFTIQEPMRNNY